MKHTTQTINSLEEIKKKVSAIGMEFLTNNTPVEMGKLDKIVDPFIAIEDSITNAITNLK